MKQPFEPLKPKFTKLDNLEIDIDEVKKLQEVMMLKLYRITKIIEELQDEENE